MGYLYVYLKYKCLYEKYEIDRFRFLQIKKITKRNIKNTIV